MTVIYFLATIVLLVVIHEWGHFATARFFGVGVRSFTVGFGKQFVSWVDPKTGTSWGIAPYPVGGYVGLLGEKETKEAVQAANEPTVTGKPFMDAPLHAKLAILFAGPLVNLVFAALLYAVLAYTAPPQPLPILASPPAGSAAAIAGLQSGDEIASINEQPIHHWRDLQVALLQASTGDTVRIGTSKGNIKNAVIPTVLKTQTIDDAMGLRLYTNGLQVQMLIADAPAATSGMKVGDTLQTINGEAIDHPAVLLSYLQRYKDGDEALNIGVSRAGEQALAKVTPKRDAQNSYKMGVQFAGIPKLGERTVDAAQAVQDGVMTAYTASVLTVKAFGAFLLKPFASDQLAGPITIAQTAKASADRGLMAALAFVAGLSISVGVLNLLPVPMLDGGQIVYHLLRSGALRFGVSQRFRFKMTTVENLNKVWFSMGIAFVLVLTLLAFFTDFKRLFGF
jgi:regulator of sigma E protease